MGASMDVSLIRVRRAVYDAWHARTRLRGRDRPVPTGTACLGGSSRRDGRRRGSSSRHAPARGRYPVVSKVVMADVAVRDRDLRLPRTRRWPACTDRAD